MKKRVSAAESLPKTRQTLVMSLALFRALVAVATAVSTLALAVHLSIASMEDELEELKCKWRWVFFGSSFLACLMVISSLKFYCCLRNLDSQKTRQGRRRFIAACVVMAILEAGVGILSFLDSRVLFTALEENESLKVPQNNEHIYFFIICGCCLVLVVLEIVSIIFASTCGRSQLYKQIAVAKDSEEKVVFERRPSSVVNVDDSNFSIENIDEDSEKQTLKRIDDNGSPVSRPFLVSNQIYDVAPVVTATPKPELPPRPPVENETPSSDIPPPRPTSPLPEDEEVPSSPSGSTKFPAFRRDSSPRRPIRGSTRSANSIFPPYEDTRFAYYDVKLGTFHRPNISPEMLAEPLKQGTS